MTLCLYHSKKYNPGYIHSGFFVCLIAVFLMITSSVNSLALDVQRLKSTAISLEENQPTLHLQNYFLNALAITSLYNANGRISLPYGQNLLFASNIYTVRKYNFLPLFASSLEINKRESITDFGMVGMVKLPLIQRKNWSIDINGKVSGSQQYLGTTHQKNRWNFEHQIGWDANYHIGDDLQATLGIYHYRIVNDTQNEDSAGSYINSGGGFASLRLQF